MANPHDENDLEIELERLYQGCGKLNPPYWAKRWHQTFTPGCQRYVGGIASVRKTLATGSRSFGMEMVKKHRRKDLTVENIVLHEAWTHLFNNDDRAKAKKNLEAAFGGLL